MHADGVLSGRGVPLAPTQVSPDGTHLLTNAMDNTLRVWDMRPYAPANRCTKVFTGHQHNFEKNLLKCDWSPDGSKVCLRREHSLWGRERRGKRGGGGVGAVYATARPC